LSCSDVVDQVSGTTYSSALGQFLYINGKTYAVSRSAVTGNASPPDGYFAFDPNITRENIFDGIDISRHVRNETPSCLTTSSLCLDAFWGLSASLMSELG